MKMEDLNKEIRACMKCRLSTSRIHALCGEGDPNAKLMLIAQAPGEKEDREGKMFIGSSGKVLDDLLVMADIERKEVYMTNLLKCMLPHYRKPKQDEIQTCSHYLDTEIALVKPEIVAPLGYYAVRYIFEKYGLVVPPKAEYYTILGKVFVSRGIKIIPLQHPASVLYNHSMKETLMKSYHMMKEVLENDM